MINIQDIIPFMKKGWVAMDENGGWYYHESIRVAVHNGKASCGLHFALLKVGGK